MMEEVRSFIAVELPADLKEELGRLQGKLIRHGAGDNIKWVEPENIHLTLKFLGGVDVDKLPDIIKVMTEAVAKVPPLKLTVKDTGVFPNPNYVQVIWVGLGGDIEPLSQLARHLETGLSLLGFAEEKRPFTPHLTLARVGNRVSPADRKQIGQLIAAAKFTSNITINVNHINLMKSQLMPHGPVYSLQQTIKFGGL